MTDPTAAFAPYHGFLQMAYVTADLDAAMQKFGQRYGVSNWLPMPGIEVETAPGKAATANIALAYVGSVQLELIEPVGGDDAIYREAVPSSGTRFHHFAQQIATEVELDAAEAAARAQLVPIAMHGSSGGGLVRYFYTDHRDTLGHYVEHIWYAPEMVAFLDQVPRN